MPEGMGGHAEREKLKSQGIWEGVLVTQGTNLREPGIWDAVVKNVNAVLM